MSLTSIESSHDGIKSQLVATMTNEEKDPCLFAIVRFVQEKSTQGSFCTPARCKSEIFTLKQFKSFWIRHGFARTANPKMKSKKSCPNSLLLARHGTFQDVPYLFCPHLSLPPASCATNRPARNTLSARTLNLPLLRYLRRQRIGLCIGITVLRLRCPSH